MAEAGRATRDGTIVWVPECHCFRCEAAALGLNQRNPRGDLLALGWRKVGRRWQCNRCANSSPILPQD